MKKKKDKKPNIPRGALCLDSRTHPHNVFHRDFFLSKTYYATPNGKIYSTRIDGYLQPTPDMFGRLQVTPTLESGNKTFLVHRLIAYRFCPNRRRLNIVHHINVNKTDNRSRNLLYVTPSEHRELHKLHKTNRREYWQRVREIKRLNAWVTGKEYLIEDEEQSTDKMVVLYSVNYRGWCHYKKSHDLDTLPRGSIICEFVRDRREGDIAS